MRKFTALFIVMALTLALSGLAYAIHEGDERGTSAPPKPIADAKAVWKYISIFDKYTNWSRWPGTEKLYEGTQPHGAFLTTYVSEDAYQVVRLKKGPLPDRSFVIKENYMQDKSLAAITVMYKVKGYNPEAGDWFWAKYQPDGTVEAAGKVEGCIKCHASKSGNDWLFTGEIK